MTRILSRRILFLIMVFPAFLLLSTGCSTGLANQPQPLLNVAKDKNQPAVKKKGTENGSNYYLQPGDKLDIKFYYNSDLNEQIYIRPDGRISLQLIDDVYVTGMTPAELKKVLTEKYSKILKDPEVAVIVQEALGQNIYIGGEVRTPGSLQLSGDLTAFQAVLRAGGSLNTAKMKSVLILRRGKDDKPESVVVNLKKVMNGHPEEDIYLRPFDIVYVPETFIAKTNEFVNQYINRIIPNIVNTIPGYGFWYLAIKRGGGYEGN